MNDINYMQIVEQTHEEKVKMYMKCTKKELISMLLQNQMLLENFTLPLVSPILEPCETISITSTDDIFKTFVS